MVPVCVALRSIRVARGCLIATGAALLALVLAVAAPPVLSQQGSKVLRIGVLSPDRGSLMSMAASRRHWIDTAFKRNGTVLAGRTPLSLEVVYADTRSQESDEFCAAKARELVESGAVILIGPVRSGCVKSVLDDGLEVPVVTTLASATDLTQQGSEWFFRASVNDLRRLRTLWSEVLAKRLPGVAGDGSRPVANLALYENSKYGRGLAADLQEVVRPDTVVTRSLPADLTAEGAAGLLEELLTAPQERQYDLFLLGSATEPAISAVLEALRDLLYAGEGIHAIYTVGSSHDLLRLSPMGVVAVGEPALGRVNTNALRGEINQLLQQAPSDLDFYPTTYQVARFIVPEAIAEAARSVSDVSDLQVLREAIRDQLATHRFDSLQPPEEVFFVAGEMESVFDLPVYQIAPEYRRINEPPVQSGWIEFPDGATKLNFLEAPLKVRVLGHQTQGNKVKLDLHKVADDGELVYTDQSSELVLVDGASSTVTFHIREPGRYAVHSNVQAYPAHFEAEARVSPFYFVCVAAAILAMLLKHKFLQIRWAMRFELLLESVVAGLAVAFISTYIQYSLLPVAPLDWNLINGILYGFIGGWFGPALITHWSSRILPERQSPA